MLWYLVVFVLIRSVVGEQLSKKLPNCDELLATRPNFLFSNWEGKEQGSRQAYQFDVALESTGWTFACAGEFDKDVPDFSQPTQNCSGLQWAGRKIRTTVQLQTSISGDAVAAPLIVTTGFCERDHRNGGTATIDPPEVFDAQATTQAYLSVVREDYTGDEDGWETTVHLKGENSTDNWMSTILTAPSLPNEECYAASEAGALTFSLSGFTYTLENYTFNFDGLWTQYAESVSSGLTNSANGFLAHCNLFGLEKTTDLGFGYWIDPENHVTCQVDQQQTGHVDGSVYPTSRAWYDPETRVVGVEHYWNCTDSPDGTELSYSATGTTEVPLACETVDAGDIYTGKITCQPLGGSVTVQAFIEHTSS
ncbi:hypothetical protein F4778DRAFT_753083 [Xylariomycetidae sp. FL2044]|nr:hypothetical protein F4778DRAFT_753083 [Xylariomycetidae sp. FL2044]